MSVTNTPNATLEPLDFPVEYLERIPLRFSREHGVIAVRKDGTGAQSRFILAVSNMDRYWVFDRVAYKLDAEVELVQAPQEQILNWINKAYHAETQEVHEIADELLASASTETEITLSEDVLELDDKAPAVKLVHAMLLQAVKQRASDVHIEPAESQVRVRFRIDGVLYERARLHAEVKDAIASRIKVMGKMDIAERRLPQDGGVTIRIGERRIDLRISTLPSQYGERVVMRLLDKTMGLLSVDALGLSPDNLTRMKKLLGLAHGIILVTGPTGCGKTTTLYAMLSAMNSSEYNILTLEDPVEYQLPGITQTQVSEKKGLTFAKGLRSLVRQDPDIIMVGEIRDLETASVAIQSALTGHLVLSTLHTNDAPSSLTRLLDLGVEPFLAASAINATLAQRLVRTLCPECAQRIQLDKSLVTHHGWSPDELNYLESLGCTQVPVAKGCSACFDTGYRGRTALHEVLFITDPIRELVSSRSPSGAIKKVAQQRGMITLRQDGLRKISQSITTLPEVHSVTQMDLE